MDRHEPTVDPTALARFHLERLERFVRLAAQSDLIARHDDGAETSRRRRLAHHAAFSAYRDCAAMGLEGSARRILERAAHPRLAR
jgi:hypothetical protein